MRTVVLVLDEQGLEIANALVTVGPSRLVDELVDPRHQHVLVVRTVEYRDFPAAGGVRMDAPEEVMSKLGGGRLLEARDAHALRVDRPEHVLDRAVLAGRVHRLQHDQDRVLVLGVEESLLVGELLEIMLGLLLGCVFRFVLARIGRIELVQPELGVRVTRNFLR